MAAAAAGVMSAVRVAVTVTRRQTGEERQQFGVVTANPNPWCLYVFVFVEGSSVDSFRRDEQEQRASEVAGAPPIISHEAAGIVLVYARCGVDVDLFSCVHSATAVVRCSAEVRLPSAGDYWNPNR